MRERISASTAVRTWRTWLPPPALERALLLRAALVSLVLHATVAYGAASVGLPRSSFAAPPLVTVMALWVMVAVTVRITLSTSEILLLGNLGVSNRSVLGVVLTGCAALEVVLRAIAWVAAS